MSTSKMKLLFLDTFSHEAKESLNLDLVQFPHPVRIAEIRVIPLGSKVELKIPGGARLGATNPSKFYLEAFINNLGLSKAATFQKIGSLDYNESNLVIKPQDLTASTDGLIVKGWYATITLAVIGCSTDDVTKDELISPPSNTESAQGQTAQWVDGLPNTAEQTEDSDQCKLSSEDTKVKDVVDVAAADSKSSEALQDQLYGDLAGGNAEGGDSDEQEMYTEEDVLAGDIITTDMTGYDEGYEGYSAFPSFNPYQFDVTQLNTYFSPAISTYELKVMTTTSELNPMAEEILETIHQFEDEPHHSRWVQSVETMIPTLASGMASLSSSVDKYNTALTTLLSWLAEGLDLNSAMVQPDTPFKVRHIKMGLRLCSSMASLSDQITSQLLEQGTEEKLFGLYTSPNMAVSIKLLIISALDSLTNFPAGIKYFLGDHMSERQPVLSGYQKLLDVAINKPMARTAVAISALIRKVHVYEILTNLHHAATQVAENALESLSTGNSAAIPVSESTDSAQPGAAEEMAESTTDLLYDETGADLINDHQAEVIISCLEEVSHVIRHAKYIIAQPSLHSLPLRKQFSSSRQPPDPYPCLYQMIDSCKLLEVLFLLLASPNTCSHHGVFTAIRSCLQIFIQSQQGLLFLSSHVETTNGIIRLLLQSADFDKDSDIDDQTAQALGLQLIYHLQALQYMDQFREFWKQQDEKEITNSILEDVELLGTLHAMLCLTVSPMGKEALVSVISWDMPPFFKLLSTYNLPSGDEEADNKNVKVCTAVKYFSDLMQVVMMYKTDLSYMEPFISKLLDIKSTDGKVMMPLLEWLEPFKEITAFDDTCIPALTKSFHSYVEQLPTVEVGLVSCLRLMHYIAIPSARPDDAPQELSYQHALLELFSKDCLVDWIKILDKLSEKQLHSWQRGVALPVNQRDLLLSIIQPTLTLIKAIIGPLIEARGVQFHDSSALQALFKTFTVVCSVSVGGMHSHTVSEIQKDIVDILVAYTQPTLTGSETDINEAMASSLWSVMLQCLLKYTVSQPCTYLSGALILSELLPIPLPMQCSQLLGSEETKLMNNNRKLWSAHLLPVTDDLEQVMITLAGSSCLHLQHAFRRLCWQLADLTSHFALLVTNILLRSFTDSLPAVSTEPTTSEVAGKERLEAGIVSANIASVLSYLSSQAPVKAALLHIVRGDNPEDSNFLKLLTVLNTVSEKVSHTQCQGHIVTILQCMCDMNISLSGEGSEETNLVTRLANDMPDFTSLVLITNAFMEHIGNYDHCYTSILLSLRSAVMLTDFTYSFNCLKKSLLQNTQALYNLFTRINNTFSKDSSDCISTLSTAVELVRLLVCADSEAHPEREVTLTSQQLRQVLNWSVQPHPLDDLEKLLVDLVEESLEGIVTNITNITQILKSEDNDCEKETDLTKTDPPAAEEGDCEKESKQSMNETSVEQTVKEANVEQAITNQGELPIGLTLQQQFNMRAVSVVPEQLDIDKLTTAYWLTNLMADDSDEAEPYERESTDLISLCETYLKDFNLEKELSKTGVDVDGLNKVAVSTSRKKQVLSLGQGGGKFTAPMRGLSVMRRGQQRGGRGNFGGTGRGDVFRSRAPNTSRPPSMHVDDFVRMETSDGSAVEGDKSQINRPPPSFAGRENAGILMYDQRGQGGRRFMTSPEGYNHGFRGGFRGRGSPGMRGSPGGFYDRGRGARFGDSPRFGRGNMMTGGMRPDRRPFSSPSGGYNRHSTSPMDRRHMNMGRPMPGAAPGDLRNTLQGGYYTGNREKDSRMMPPPLPGDMRQPRSSERRSDGQRDSYRSYSK